MSPYFCDNFSSSQSLFLNEGLFPTDPTDKLKPELNITVIVNIVLVVVVVVVVVIIARWMNKLGRGKKEWRKRG